MKGEDDGETGSEEMTPIEFLRLRNSGDCSEELKFLRERNEERRSDEKKRKGKGKAPTYSEIFDRAIELAGRDRIVETFVKVGK